MTVLTFEVLVPIFTFLFALWLAVRFVIIPILRSIGWVPAPERLTIYDKTTETVEALKTKEKEAALDKLIEQLEQGDKKNDAA